MCRMFWSHDSFMAKYHSIGRRCGACHHHGVSNCRSNRIRDHKRRRAYRPTRSPCPTVSPSGFDHLYLLCHCRDFFYWFAGRSVFDAMNHSFAAVSTGGFPTRAESLGYWDSASIEAVTLPLMLLGNLSFVTAWYLWRGKLHIVTRNGEIHLLAVLIPLSVAAMFLMTSRSIYPQLGKSIRVSIFETASAITTTGFSTVAYSNWNSFGLLLLILLMLIGGGTCSTAGGIKQIRIYLLWKLFIWDIRRSFMPRTAILERPFWEGPRRGFVDDARVG
jgi:trk system potassium uptake protein